MRASAVVFIAILAGAAALSLEGMFDRWLEQYPHAFPESERAHRLANFEASIHRVEYRRKMNGDAPVTWGLTKFADLSVDEFAAKYLNAISVPDLEAVALAPKSISSSANFTSILPDVTNEGECADDIVISSVAQLGAAWATQGNTYAELSTQQVLDCGNVGCQGGEITQIYHYAVSRGLESAQTYPNSRSDTGTCQYNPEDVYATFSGWKLATKNKNETAMQAASLQYGPPAVCVDAMAWQDYTGGVLLAKQCGMQVDHCVVVAGWNTEGRTPYWVLENSWGSDWGMNGYIEIEFGKNACGIATVPVTGVVNGQPNASSSGSTMSSTTSTSTGAPQY